MRAGFRRSQIARHLWKTTALTALTLGLSGVVAHADPDGLWQPQVRAIIGADNNGGNAALEGFIPIKQTAESVLFLDVRAKHDFKDASGQDIGLGIRRIVNPDLMLGGYAYINVENYNSTQFTAGTLGVEAITPNFDAHVNVFVPIKGDTTDHSVSSSLSMVSNQLIEQISVLDHRDYAAWGIEGEIGAQVPINLPDKHSLRLDIGGYHFEDPHGDDGSVTGAKAGFEYKIGDVFGSGTELVLAGEVRDDNRDHTQFAGSVRLNIPFNPGHGSDATGAISDAGPVYPVSEGLRKRVNERVRGDIGVRVQSQDKTAGSTTRVAINAATNAAFGKFYFADGGLAGAGTQADPTTLDDAVTKAGNGGFIVALGGNGNIRTSGQTLAAGQTLIGGGESVTAKLFGGGTATFNLGGSDGTIQGTNVANNVITLGTGNTLKGITITGGADGIFGNNAANTTLTNVTVTGAGGNGAAFTGNSTTVNASGFTATGNGLDGLHIEDNGTYNFAGTTVLSSNLDDGLDITGHGTYTFAIVNAQNNTDRGITVQGTSSGGTFTTTGGTISGNGGIGVYIDPITAHVVLDSIDQNGGPAGVVLDHVSGSFTVNGATTIKNTTGAAIQITDSPAAIRFGGDVTIQAPNAGGIDISGINGVIGFGNVYISGLTSGKTGLDLSGSTSTFTATLLNITGTGTSTGIDLSGTAGGSVVIGSGTISVGTGVQLGTNGASGTSANTTFSFGGGSITGTVASLDARGLNQTQGTYAFGSTDLVGPQLFDTQNVIFVGSTATGSGTGSSLLDLASIATADANTASNAIFVLVNNATNTPIDASGGFSLSAGQTLASFGNGRTFSLGGIPVNVTGDNIQHDVVVSDPGTGAATLTNSGAGAVVTAASGGTLEDFNISGGSGAAISASGSGNLIVQGVTVSGGVIGLSLNGFSGTGAFNNLDITGAGTGVSITGGTTSTLTFDAASSIAGSTGVAFNIDSSTPNLTYNGTIDQTAAATTVKINAMTGGSATFGGLVTASTGAATAIDLTANTGGAVTFTGGLNIDTTSGTGFSATGGGTISVAATAGDESITTGTGQAVNLDGVTIGASGMSFDSITTGVTTATALNFNAVAGGTFSGGAVHVVGTASGTDAIAITNSPATFTFSSATIDSSGGEGIALSGANGAVTFTTVDIDGTTGRGIDITGSSNNITIGGGTVGATTPSQGFGVSIANQTAGTISLGTLEVTASGADALAIDNSAGTITMGAGKLTQTGSSDALDVSGGSATITIGATIANSGSAATSQAVEIDGTSGNITISGNVTASNGAQLFSIGSTMAPTGGTISFTGSSLTATGGGGAVIAGLGGSAIFNATAPVSITNATGNGLSVSNVASGASATFGAVTISGAGGNGIDISGNAGTVTFGATTVTVGSADDTAGIHFSGTNANVIFGMTKVTLGGGANQTGIDFSGSSTAAAFGVTTITGNGLLSSRGIDLSSTTGNKTITFLAGSGISNVGIGVQLSSGHSTATSANANFTFGDGTSANGLQSSISVISGGYTVDTVGLDPTLGNYNFNDVFFTGNANLASAVGGVTMVSQNGGVIAMGTDGLSAAVSTISVAQADALTGTQTFAFVGTVDLSNTPFTLDSGQTITGFGNNTAITTAGTIQPVNVQGNLGATGGTVTGNEAVVTGTGDFLHLLGNNQVRNTTFDFTGASGSVFTIDQSAAGFGNAGGITIEGITVSNVGAGSTAFKIGDLGTTNVSITNNNINVAGTLLDANGGTGDITLTRGNLPNSGPVGTLTGGGISIANRTGGTVDFHDHVTVGGNGVSLTNNMGSTVTFADLDVSTSGATAFSASGGGTINVGTGTVANANGQAVALDDITANINFASTSATFSSGNGIDLQNLSGTAAFGTGTLTNAGPGTSFNVGSATAASGGNADISYAGTIASNGSGAAVSIQGMTGGSVTLSGDLTDGLADSGGNVVVAGNDSAAITFSGSTKQIDSGATDGVDIGIVGGYPNGTLVGNTNSTFDFSNGGLDIKTTTGVGFAAVLGGTVSVSGSGNKITSGADGLAIAFADVGSAGVTFDSISAHSRAPAFVGDPGGAGVYLSVSSLGGDVNIGGLKDTGYIGASLSDLSGTGKVNFTGTTDLDVSYAGFDIGGLQVGTINIANVAGSTLTIDGGQYGIIQTTQGGTVNVGVAGNASITNTTLAAISLGGGNDLAFTTLTYNGSITVGAGAVLSASGDGTRLNMSGSVNSTTSSTAFDFFGHADGIYDISSTIDHSGGTGVFIGGSANGTVTFSGTSKTFNTGANDAIFKAPVYGPDPQTKGTLAFTNGGLVITTTSGAGFTASTFGPGTVSVTKDGGADNTIATTTGTALDLDGATVGAGGVTFDSISVNGAATGISLNNVSGGAVDLGVVDLKKITGSGVDISGTLAATLNATSIKIGLNAANAIGLDLNGASLGASDITAGDFDVDGGSNVGTIGIDMAGTTGTGTIQLGDLINNNPGGQTSKIENVGYGVQFSNATNANLVFGDGAATAESTIATFGNGQVIHATDSLPTNGDYNFNDVSFSGDISNLSSISVYYVTADATGAGDGSLANPGTYANAQLSSANVIVLIDKTTGGVQQTIDLGSTSYQLHDGQVLLAFKSDDAAVDVSQLGVAASGGASAAFHFTTVQNSTIVSAPIGIDTLRPVLQSNTSGSVINLATSGTGTITGGVQNLIIRNLGAGGGITANATSASSFFLRNNDIAVGGRALDFATSGGATADTLLLSIDGNTLQSNGGNYAAAFSGENVSATQNSLAIRSFSNNTVLNGTGNGSGLAFTNVTFDSTGAGGTVAAGTLAIGMSGASVQGNGLSLTGTSGTLDLGTLTIFNNSGTGLLVDTKGPPATNFTLNSSGGSVDTTNGTALNLDPLTVNMTLGSVTATGGTSGIVFDGVAGTFTVTGATSITGTTDAGISAIGTNAGTFNFNTVTIDNSGVGGVGIGWASGTLAVNGLANIDTTSGAGLTQSGGTTNFNGGVTIDTTTGVGIAATTGSTVNILATPGSETVNSANGQAITLSGVTANITLDSTTSGGGGNGVALTNVGGTVALGGGALSGAISTAFIVNGGTAAVSYSGTVNNQATGAAALIVQNRLAGAGLVALSGNLTSTGIGMQFASNAGGTVTVSGASNSFTGGSTGIIIGNNTGGTYNISGASYIINTNSGQNGINISSNSSPVTINFDGGGLAVTTTSGAGLVASGAGTINVTGSGNTIQTATGQILTLSGVTIGGGGVNFSSLQATGTVALGDAINVTSVAGGTFNGGAVSVAGTAANGDGIEINGSSATFNFTSATIAATAGNGILLSGANGAVTFSTVTINDTGLAGIRVYNNTNAVNVNGGSIGATNDPSGIGVDINSGTGNVTIAASVAKTTLGNVVQVSGRTAGTVDFSGSISTIANGIDVSGNSGTAVINFSSGTKTLTTAGATAVNLTNNTGATINFTGGGLIINTTSGTGFTATGGGTVTVQGTGNMITSTTGTALNVVNTTIGSGNLTFRSISSNGAVNGIVLNNTGTSGGLNVTGDGGSSNNGSGGTIQNTSGAGISLTNTQNVSFDQVHITATGGSGVDGTGVTNFSFTNGTVSNAGNAGFESAIAFNGSGSGLGNNINGTLTVTGNTFTNAFYSGLDVHSDNGTVTNATVSGNTITNPGFSGVNFVGTGNASTAFNLNNATIANNTISGSGANGIQISVGNSNASGPGAHAGFVTFDGLGRPISDPSHIISITGNAITLDPTGTQAITVANSGANSGSRTQTNFEIKNNGTIGTPLGSSSIGTVILIGNNGFSDMAGVVDNNVIVATHTPNGGGGNGIAGGNGVAGAGNAWTPNLNLSVTNNTISGTDGNGILLVGRGTSGIMDLKVANNSVGAPVNAGGTAREGIRVDAGNAASANDQVFLNIFGNTSAGSNGAAGIGVRKQGTNPAVNVFGLYDASGGPALPGTPTNVDIQTFINALNPSGNGTDIISGSGYVRDTTQAPP